MQQTKDVLMKLRRVKAHFQKKGFLEENETSSAFYKGKASGLQLAIEHVQQLLTQESDEWETFINKMVEEYNEIMREKV